MSQPAERRGVVTFGEVLSNREFRSMYGAQALSIVGDQLARVAIALLVYMRSGSPALTALTFAVSYLPWLVVGPLLSGYADRLPRRSVMVACDLARTVLVLLLAIPHVPLPVVFALLLLVAVLEPPFTTARASTIPDLFHDPDAYSTASMLSNTTNQLSVAIGYVLAGAVVAGLGARTAMVVDALTFACSALLVLRRVTHRPPADDSAPTHVLDDVRYGARIVFADPQLRWLVLMAGLIFAAVLAVSGVAVPYAHAHGGGSLMVGLLLASLQVGMVAGGVALARLVRPDVAERLMLPLALLTPVALAMTAFDPPPVVTGALWLLAGAFSAAQIVANRVFVARVAPEVRGRAFAIAAACIAVGQTVGTLVAGALVESVGPAVALADVALPVFAALVVLSALTFASSGSEAGPMPEVNAQGGSQSGDDSEEDEDVPSRGDERSDARVWGFNALLVLVAVLTVPALRGHSALIPHTLSPIWLLLLFVIAISAPLHFVFRRQPWSVYLTDVPLVLALFFLSPLTLVVVRTTAAAVAFVLVRRQPPIRAVYNIAATVLHTVAAVTVFRLLVPTHDGVHPGTWAATVTAVVADALLSVVLLGIVIYLSEGQTDARARVRVAAVTVGAAIINTALALCTASALSYDASSVWAIAVFVVLSIAAVRTYKRLADRHAALDRLYAVARELGPIAADPTDLGPALTQLRRIVDAETLELAMLGDDPAFATVIQVLVRDHGETVHVADREVDTATRLLLQTSQSPAWGAARWRPLLTRQRRTEREITVAVGGAERPVAVLTARNRAGDVGGFDQAHVRLLEAAANQLAAALEKGRLVESLRRAATRDSLTDLANLDSLREFLVTMLDGSAGGVLLLLDLDRFQEVNDTLGHDIGDAILCEVARRLESAPTHGALVARVGGDQFALAIPGQAGGEVARLAALAVKSRIDGPVRFHSVSADIRVTVGIARAPEHGTDAATLLRRAEMAMTAAKGTPAGIGEWEPGYERDGSRRLQLLAGLRQGLSENEVWVEFQPKIRLGTGEVTGFEALARWRHPELGLVSPAEFVPLAETSGLVGALTTTVLRLALESCRRWHDVGLEVGIAVNISARSLDDPVLVGQVAAMLTATGLEPHWLTLEITESSVMENSARSVDVLLQLRSLGVRLSIDDFGTGYSSLHQLRGLPVHEVKIDKAFVDHVGGDGADRAVVHAIVELCDSLGLATVAEGVEHAAQAYALESLGVTQVQGYFYGRPMSEPVASEWLSARPVATPEPPDMARG